MIKITRIASFLIILILAASVGAYAAPVTIDFVGLANGATYGESAYSTFTYVTSDPSLTLTVTATRGSGTAAYAYLDAGHGGLGDCEAVLSTGQHGGSTANVCTNSSDDNVDAAGEKLMFSFNKSVTISTLVFNDNHDAPDTMVGGVVNINGTITGFAAGDAVGNGDYSHTVNYTLAANTNYYVAYATGSDSARQFYVSSITVSPVPEPASLAFLGFGLLGLAVAGKRLQPAYRRNR